MTGRPSTFTQELADEICDEVANGRSLRAWIQGGEDRPSFATIYRWLEAHDAFREAYACARETMAHADADRINHVSELLEAGVLAPDVARVITDAMKWTAARRAPKAYGDKLALAGNDGAPLVVRWADGSE